MTAQVTDSSETIAAVIIAAAAMAAVVDPEHALDGAHGAADTGADRATHHAADRAGDPVAFPGALLRAAHDALGIAELRHREQREDDRRRRQNEFGRQAGRQRGSADLSSSSEFLDAGHDGSIGRECVTPVRPKGCLAGGQSAAGSGCGSPKMSRRPMPDFGPAAALLAPCARINDALAGGWNQDRIPGILMPGDGESGVQWHGISGPGGQR